MKQLIEAESSPSLELDNSMVQIQKDLGLENAPDYKRSTSLPNMMQNDNPPLILKSNINAKKNMSEENKSAVSIKGSESISIQEDSSRSSIDDVDKLIRQIDKKVMALKKSSSEEPKEPININNIELQSDDQQSVTNPTVAGRKYFSRGSSTDLERSFEGNYFQKTKHNLQKTFSAD